MHTGVPAKPAANIVKLAPGFVPQFSWLALALAGAASAAWVALVRWRTGRHREALWKSLVLPAGGVALCWLLLMTLGLPLFDYARSPRPLVDLLARVVPRGPCIAAPGLSPVAVAALEHFGRWRVQAAEDSASPDAECPLMLRVVKQGPAPPPLPGWERLGELRRPTDREELTVVDRRAPAR
jgi:hypothetical protein